MLLRLSYLFILIAVAAAAFFYVYFSRQNDVSPSFVGSSRCGVCHTQESMGSQFRIWKTGPHSKAFSLLGEDSVKLYLKEHNIVADSCMSCHTTLGRISLNRYEAALNSEGVGCERCHGPGSEYALYNIMNDHQAFVARGGVSGSLEDCTQCHVANLDSVAHHCPFQTRNFNVDSAWIKIQHQIPTKPATPDTVQQLRES